MDHGYGEIGQVSNMTCVIEIKQDDWESVSLRFKYSMEYLAVVQRNGTQTIYNNDSLLRPEFSINGSMITAVVSFDLTNFTSDRCSSRQFTLLCSVNMTNGPQIETRADFDIIGKYFYHQVSFVSK
jgi:hypothetical protein